MSRPLRTTERRALLVVGDLLAVTMATLLALWTWSLTAGFPFGPSFLTSRAVWFLAVPLWAILLTPTRAAGVALDIRRTATGIARGASALLVIYLAAFFWAGGERLPRLVALYLLWDATLLVFAWRAVAVWSLTHAALARRIVVVGSGWPLETSLKLLAEDASFKDATVVGIASTGPTTASGPVVGTAREVDELAKRLHITDIVVAFEPDAAEVDGRWIDSLIRCQEAGVNVIRMAQLYENTLRRVPVQHVDRSWLLTDFFDVAHSREASPLAKRLLDIAAASILGIVGLVVGPFVALAVLLEGGRPVLYSQERLGRGGRLFRITKFRTMRTDAEADGTPRWAQADDPRVTRVGRWLRRARLDELPNVVAVLRGDMSMVGPRPERPEFVEQLEREVPLYRTRLIATPGLTGWAQVNVPYGDSVDSAVAKLEYDLYYIKHQSMAFDIAILLRTAGTVLGFGGR